MKIVYTVILSISFLTGFSQAGSLDNSFSGDGKVVTPVGAANEENRAVAIQSDGKILVAGWDGDGSFNTNFLVIRYNSDGSLDTGFDGDGIAIVDLSGDSDRAYAIAIQSDGKIVAGGYAYTGSDPAIGLIRLNADGSPDNSFDGDGIVTLNPGTTNDQINALAIQPDGKILAAGSSSISTGGNFIAVRFNSNGTPDASFDGDGIAVWDIGGDDFCNAMVLQPDGKIVLGGKSGSATSDTDYCIARLNSDGSQDSGFGTVVSNFGSTIEEIMALGLQSDGKIVAGGYRHNGSDHDFAAIRYLADGSIDNSFDADGYVYIPVGSDDDVVHDMGIQNDGKIVLAGTRYSANPDFALVRLNNDGSTDNSFDGDGIATADFSGGFDDAFGMAIQSDGKIVLTGLNQNSTTDVATARFNAAGSVDVAEGNASPFSIFPNPAREHMTLRNTSAGGNYLITDISGKLVIGGKLDEGQTVVDLQGLEPGCYLIQCPVGEEQYRTRFIIQ